MNTTNKQKNGRKNKAWLRNPDQRKHPKVFNVKMVQTRNGDFILLGKEAEVYTRFNQYSGEWNNVDVRDLACEMRNNKIMSL
jgi:hypothetical protein